MEELLQPIYQSVLEGNMHAITDQIQAALDGGVAAGSVGVVSGPGVTVVGVGSGDCAVVLAVLVVAAAGCALSGAVGVSDGEAVSGVLTDSGSGKR